jgi:methionine-S-sulfoxide reductase
MSKRTQTAVFGGGCFWCVEAIFQKLKGVHGAVSGYAGGTIESATYTKVSSGATDHVEVISIEYDPVLISYDDLLTVFFASHDPTTLNRQGNDVGTQYRSVIFYTSEQQKKNAAKYIDRLKKDGINVLTTLERLKGFTKAEKYHQNYYQDNMDAPYCQIVIAPKIEKVEKKFRILLKDQGYT